MGQARGWAPRLTGRVVLLFGGCLVAAVCYAATIKADLGLGPLYAVQQGVARHLHISQGHAVMITGSILCLVAASLRTWPGIGTVSLPFIMGAYLDALTPHMPDVHGVVVRVGVVVVASWFMALGGAIIIRGRVGAAAPDLCMLAISERTGRSNRVVRLSMEASWLVAGWLLGGTIGVGTVITGMLIGPALHFWIELLTRTSSDDLPRVVSALEPT